MPSFIRNSLIAATMLVSAAPVLAAGGSGPTTRLTYDAKTQTYCVQDPAITGSHLSRRTCKTAAQWSADGLDMPKTTLADTRMATTAPDLTPTTTPVTTIAQK